MKLLGVYDLEPFPFYEREGPGSLEEKLRGVPLRGVNTLAGQPVRVYEHARLSVVRVAPEELRQRVFTGQPMVYQTHLDFLAQLERAFLEKANERITQLTRCWDFTSRFIDEKGEEQETRWTLMPPLIEENLLPVEGAVQGRLRYEDLPVHRGNGYALNPALRGYEFGARRYKVVFPLICDGIHRIYLAYGRGEPVAVSWVSGLAEGFPYYAHPQPFEKIRVVPSHDHEHDPEYADLHKVHVLDKEHEKRLYRLFPAVGLNTGGVRPDAVLKK